MVIWVYPYYCGMVWVLRQDQHPVSAASDLLSLRRCQSRLVLFFGGQACFFPCHPGRTRVGILNLPDSLLSCGKWDHLQLVLLLHSVHGTPLSLSPRCICSLLLSAEAIWLSFPHCSFNQQLLRYRAGQQGARQQTHEELVAALDGIADLRANRQGTVFVAAKL